MDSFSTGRERRGEVVGEGRAFQGDGILHVQDGLEKQEGKRTRWLPGFHGRGMEGVGDAPCSWGERAQLRCNGTSLLWQPLCTANCSISADLPSLLAEAAHFIKERGLALHETGVYFFSSHCVCFLSHYWVSRGFMSIWFRKKSGVADQTWYWVKILHLTKVLFKLAITPMGVSREQSLRL